MLYIFYKHEIFNYKNLLSLHLGRPMKKKSNFLQKKVKKMVSKNTKNIFYNIK